MSSSALSNSLLNDANQTDLISQYLADQLASLQSHNCNSNGNSNGVLVTNGTTNVNSSSNLNGLDNLSYSVSMSNLNENGFDSSGLGLSFMPKI